MPEFGWANGLQMTELGPTSKMNLNPFAQANWTTPISYTMPWEKTSDKYSTYAEYARRTLLRLRVVQGLSDELRALIVIRGIDSPQFRAAAANGQLTTETIVSFLSIYTKPNKIKLDKPVSSKHPPHQGSNVCSGPKYFNCGLHGHVSKDCKRPKSNTTPNTQPVANK